MHVGNGRDIPDTLDGLTLERLAATARLYRDLNLPVAVTGGLLPGAHASLAGLMREELEENYNVPVTWSEEESHTTFENAMFTDTLLKSKSIGICRGRFGRSSTRGSALCLGQSGGLPLLRCALATFFRAYILCRIRFMHYTSFLGLLTIASA
jgi:hypothetical protein